VIGVKSFEAYQLCLKANFWLNKVTEEDYRKAIANQEQAIRIDSNYAPA
jgi:hypothetical protein